MAKYYGKIGFASCEETPTGSGIWVDDITTRQYRGDILNTSYRWQQGQEINSNATVSQRISIISDSYVLNNIPSIKYIEFLGALWCVASIEIQRPRIILTLGGIYNGEQN